MERRATHPGFSLGNKPSSLKQKTWVGKLFGKKKKKDDVDYSQSLPAEFADTKSDALDYDWEKYGAPEYKKNIWGKHVWKTPKYHWEERGQISDKAIQEKVTVKEKKDKTIVKQKQKVFELGKKGKYKRALSKHAQPYRLHLPMPGHIPEKTAKVLGPGVGAMFGVGNLMGTTAHVASGEMAKGFLPAIAGGAGMGGGALIPSISNLLNIQTKKLSKKKWLSDWQKKGTPGYVSPFVGGGAPGGGGGGSGKAKFETHAGGASVTWGSRSDLESGKYKDPSAWKGKTRLKPLIPGTKGLVRKITDYGVGQWWETPIPILPKRWNPFNPKMTKKTKEYFYKPTTTRKWTESHQNVRSL